MNDSHFQWSNFTKIILWYMLRKMLYAVEDFIWFTKLHMFMILFKVKCILIKVFLIMHVSVYILLVIMVWMCWVIRLTRFEWLQVRKMLRMEALTFERLGWTVHTRGPCIFCIDCVLKVLREDFTFFKLNEFLCFDW